MSIDVELPVTDELPEDPDRKPPPPPIPPRPQGHPEQDPDGAAKPTSGE